MRLGVSSKVGAVSLNEEKYTTVVTTTKVTCRDGSRHVGDHLTVEGDPVEDIIGTKTSVWYFYTTPFQSLPLPL